MSWRTIALFLVAAVYVVAIVRTRWYVPPPTPNPPGSFAFAALGDAPYNPIELRRFQLVLRDMEAHDLRWVLHIGDIFDRPCSDDHYRTALARFNSLRHPVIYTPGDNEWTDCWDPGPAGYSPRERLTSLRRIFFAQPRQSLGGNPIPLVTQADRAEFQEFVENVRWTHAGMMFATVHLVGSRNGLAPYPGRTKADDEEVFRRTEAAAAWLRETFAEAMASEASALVLGFHGTLGFGLGLPMEQVEGYEPFTSTLEEVVERFGKPVLAIHGEAHEFTVDQPLVHRRTKTPFPNFTRLEVPGSPDVGACCRDAGECPAVRVPPVDGLVVEVLVGTRKALAGNRHRPGQHATRPHRCSRRSGFFRSPERTAEKHPTSRDKDDDARV